MALFNLKDLKKNVQKSAGGIMKTVSDVTENLPVPVKNIDVGEPAKEIAQAGQSTLETLKEKGEGVLGGQLKKEAKPDTRSNINSSTRKSPLNKEMTVSIRDSIRLIYCLMSADGVISPEEEATLLEIGKELDPSFESYRDEIVDEGTQLMRVNAADEEEYYDLIHDHAAKIIYEAGDAETGIGAKALIWDLLLMAFSEGDYSANEKRLIRFITRALQVDPAVALEMEQSIRAIRAIETEEVWLKETNRQYSRIEERLRVLKNRRENVMQGVNALMVD